MKTSSIGRAVTAVVLAAGISAGMAGSAEATTTQARCTVTAKTPNALRHLSATGVKQIRYDVKITCQGNRKITVRQRFMEKDSTWQTQGDWADFTDDQTGSNTLTQTFQATGSVTVGTTRLLADTESTAEEIYQQISFKVRSNGVTSPWSAWEQTPYITVAN